MKAADYIPRLAVLSTGEVGTRVLSVDWSKVYAAARKLGITISMKRLNETEHMVYRIPPKF